MKYICRSKNESGFTLIEMAVVVVIVGIVISIMATVLPSLIQSAKIRKARAILEKVDYSLEGYISASGQCPCPDTDGDGKENRNDGGTPNDPSDDICTDYVGYLPYLTLGLSSGEDNWHNPIKYAVYEDLIKTTSSTGSNYYCYKLRDIINHYRTNPADTNKLYTTLGSDNTNQAYVIVTGGPKDLDGTGGFFDGLNIGSDVQFESPIKIVDKDYDDLVRAVSFNYLRGRECGGDGGGGGGGGVENSYPNGCTNGIDDDGDLLIDCDDPDCFGHPACLAGGENVKIATTSVPGGNVNDENYAVTFTASGGITPYEWELLNNGGFTDFYLHPYAGRLSGTISQCPGNYSIQVKVVDSTQPTVTSDTKSFNIEVRTNLEVARTSGSGTDIEWNSTSQEETFKANGGHLGDIDWTLDTGGATGFVYGATGDTTYIKKNGTTTPNTYTFTLTAKDHDCSTTNQANIVLTVTVTESGAGAPYTEGMEAEWRMDECSWDGSTGEVVDSCVGSGIPPDPADYSGTAMNSAFTIGTGKMCRCASTDIVSAYILLDPVLNIGSEWTIAAWFYWPLASQGSGWWTLTRGTNDHQILVNRGSNLLGTYDNQGGTGWHSSGFNMSSLREGWHHITAVGHASQTDFYIDGVLKGTADYKSATDIKTLGNYIGGSQNWGKFDEMKVWSKALSEDEIIDLYNTTSSSCTGACYTDPIAEYRMENFPWNGTASEVEDSGTGASHGVAAAHGTGALPSQTTPSGGKVCRAGVFTRDDANNGGYLDLGDPTDGDLDPYTDPWTISAWIKWDGLSGENIIYNKENLYETRVNGGYVNYAWQPYWAWDGGSSLPVTANEWTYVTTVYDGSQQILYKNGDMVYSRAQIGAMGNNSSKLLIGARGSASPSNFFGGMIDEVKIYNRALAENEIKADKDETRDCSADTVVITTTELPDGTIYSAYSYIIAATGGEKPPDGYGWEIVSSDIPAPPLKIGSNTGELNGTLEVCAGDYNITVRVTDANSRTDERTFTLTVVNDILTISPSAPRTFNCTTSDFSRDFSVSGPRGGALDNWAITWVTDPGGFEVIKTGDATVRFRKIGTSSTGTYHFRLTANDSICTNNTIDSGLYILNISGDGTGTPYYAGCVGEWWMDESSGTIEDHSSQNNDGTVYGGVTYGVQGKVWTALDFDGSSGYVDCGNDVSLNFNITDPFSIAAWVKTTDTSGVIVAKMGSSPHRGFQFLIHDNRLQMYLINTWSGNSIFVRENTQGSFTDNNWHHAAVTYDGSKSASGVKLYLDGQPVVQTTVYDSLTAIMSTLINLRIGRRGDNSLPFDGIIDEAYIYNRELSAGEIRDIYNQGGLVAYYKMDETGGGTAPGGKDIYDYSGQANHGTNSGAAYGATGQIGTALEFDGTDYVNIGNNEVLTPSDISISAWVKASTLDNWNGIITNKPGANHGINLQMGTNNKISALVGNGSSCTYVSTTWAPAVDTWYHIVITHNSSDNNNILYVNGNKETESTFALAYSTPVDTIIGRFYTGSLPFKGIIDEIRIYDQVLSADDVTALYNKGIEEGG